MILLTKTSFFDLKHHDQATPTLMAESTGTKPTLKLNQQSIDDIIPVGLINGSKTKQKPFRNHPKSTSY